MDVYFLNVHLFHSIKTDQIILFILFMNGLKCEVPYTDMVYVKKYVEIENLSFL